MNIPPEQVAALYSISLRSLNNWIRRFNQQGLDGLIEGERTGRPAKITPEQSAHYRQLIEQPELADQLHWTAVKFHGYLRQELQHEIGYRTVVRWLHDNNFRLKVPQPWPDRQDETQRQLFLERLKAYLLNDDIDIWYLDEMGIEGDPRPRRRWAQKGAKIRVGDLADQKSTASGARLQAKAKVPHHRLRNQQSSPFWGKRPETNRMGWFWKESAS